MQGSIRPAVRCRKTLSNREDSYDDQESKILSIVLAGGEGTRLMPFNP